MILDTNALSDIFKENKTIKPYIEKADEVYVPVIVLGEYLFGIKGSTKANELSILLFIAPPVVKDSPPFGYMLKGSVEKSKDLGMHYNTIAR